MVRPGDDLAAITLAALDSAHQSLAENDVLVVTSKIVSRAEGRFVDLTTVTPASRAAELAAETSKDPRLVQLILRESAQVSRKARGVLVVRHRLGFVAAHAGIDLSNSVPEGAAA